MIKVVLGNHWCPLGDWVVLEEKDQDITKPLQFVDNSVDCLFMEHVIEHITFHDALKFFKEAYRSLKPGGVLRIVAPDLDKLFEFNYAKYCANTYNNEYCWVWMDHFGVSSDYWMKNFKVFFVNWMVHSDFNHKFVWDKNLLSLALEREGFQVKICDCGKGTNPEFCIERRYRGLLTHMNPPPDFPPYYDAESFFVEGIKTGGVK